MARDELEGLDLRLLRRAFRQRWPIPPERREEIVRKLLKFLETTESTRDMVQGVRALAELDKANLSEQGQALDFLRHRERQEQAGGGAPVRLVEELEVVSRPPALPAPGPILDAEVEGEGSTDPVGPPGGSEGS